MKRNKRKANLLPALLLAALLLTGCGAAPEDDPYASYELHWEETSAAQAAMETQTLRLYFMSGEGLATEGTEKEGKWGDCCLIAFPNGEVMLVDAALDKYAPVLVRNLQKLGVAKLDYLVLSHPHDDHYGGLAAEDGLLQHFEIGTVYYGGTYNGKETPPDYMETLLDEHALHTQILTQGDALDIGDVHIDVLWPHPDSVGVTYASVEEVNNHSLVLRLQYGDISALFCGDIYNSAEWELVKELGASLDADILKIPHHGNTTSSSRDFAQAVTPQVSVATGGIIMMTNVYYRYTSQGSRVYTDLTDGYVRVVTDGSTIDTQTSRARGEHDPYAAYEYQG